MMTHPAMLPLEELLKSCEESRTRRSGPGGQHRNKTETAVILKHTPTGITAEGSERRSQAENRDVALFRLRVNLAIEVRSEVTNPLEPSELWRSRCRSGKIAVNPTHEDFPALLAEALDAISAADFDLKPAAERLTVSTSQLLKFLKDEPRALQFVNRERTQRGVHALH